MNRDILFGLAGSVLIHAGTFFSDYFIDYRGAPARPTIQLIPHDPMEIPRFETEEIERPPAEREEAVLTFVPPQQIDTPTLTANSPFVQAVQPPPPDLTRLQAGIPDDVVDARGIGRGANGNIFEPTMLDQIPRIRGYRTPPVYPFDMRRNGIEGEVLVDFLVDAEGNVLNARAVGASHREFEPSAVAAVTKWKFHPGRKDGQNVVTHMQVPIVFSLEQK